MASGFLRKAVVHLLRRRLQEVWREMEQTTKEYEDARYRVQAERVERAARRSAELLHEEEELCRLVEGVEGGR